MDLRIEHGQLNIPTMVARMLGNQSLRLVSWSEHHLLVEPLAQQGQVLLAGTLGEIGVIDLLSFCNMFRKTGLLHFQLAGGDKSLYFRAGEISFAASTFPEEQIGAILHGLGKVDQDKLQVASCQADSQMLLGQLLVKQGIVTPQDLWAATRSMVETIVYSLVTFHAGQFVLVDHRLPDDQMLSLSMSTQNLIMEGLRRFDERALYLQRISSLEAIPVVTGSIPKELDGSSKKLLELIAAGSDDAREVLRRSGFGDFDGLRLLSQLVERGLVIMEEAPNIPIAGELAEVIAIFNGVLTAMYRVVSARTPDFSCEVGRFLRALPQPFSYVFRQVNLREDGSIDGARLAANLQGLGTADQLRLLTDALSELVYMECMAVRRELGAADSANLIRRVQGVSQRVQTLIGRRNYG